MIAKKSGGELGQTGVQYLGRGRQNDSRHGTAVRTEQWRYAESGKTGVNGALLPDPPADPLEMKNLANGTKYNFVVVELSALTRQDAAPLG